MNNKERIQKYLHGQLNSSEQKALEEELLTNPELLAEFDFQRFIASNLGESDEQNFRNKLGKVYHRFRKKENQLKRKRRRLTLASVLVSAAVFILLLLLVNTGNKPKSGEELYHEFYKPFTQDISGRSPAVGSGKEGLYSGIDEYNRGNYREAYRRLSAYLNDLNDEDYYALFYRGLSLLELKEFENAARDFEDLPTTEFNFLQEHADWYLLLSYLKLENYTGAETLTEKMSATDRLYEEKLKKIKKALNSILS